MKGSKVRILKHLENYGSITSFEAFELYGITRLAARVKELREKGYDINTLMIEGVNRYGEACRYAKYVYRGESNGN